MDILKQPLINNDCNHELKIATIENTTIYLMWVNLYLNCFDTGKLKKKIFFGGTFVSPLAHLW